MRYVLESLVGEGGMGQVFAARDESGRDLVVKRLHERFRNDPLHLKLLADEALLSSRVSHHNVVRVLEHGGDADGPYIVMARAEGATLSSIIERDGVMSPRRAFAIASQILAGIAAIHNEGIVHGDIKSSNILVDANDRVTIIDFGLAHPIMGRATRDHVIAGTPAYMAPEITTGAQASPVSDLYAIGVIIYEMLVGDTVFAGAENVLQAHRCQLVPPPSRRATRFAISHVIDNFVLRALAKQPSERFGSAGDMGRALDRLMSNEWETTTVVIAVETQDVVVETTETTAIANALEEAQPLIAARRPRAAIDELEAALAKLRSAETWRIEMVLAALYDQLGRKEQSRRFALVARSHARQTNCATAIERTQKLVERLTPAIALPPRIARGSGFVFKRRAS